MLNAKDSSLVIVNSLTWVIIQQVYPHDSTCCIDVSLVTKLMNRMARIPKAFDNIFFKQALSQRVDKSFCRVSSNLPQMSRLSSIAMDATSTMMTQYHWSEVLSMAMCLCSMWVFMLEGIVCGLMWILPGLLAQNILYMNEYISSFQPWYVKRTFQMVSCAATLWQQLVMGLMVIMKNCLILKKRDWYQVIVNWDLSKRKELV